MSIKQVVLRAFLLVALATPASVAAKADTLDFSITGHGTDITFSLPSSPTPSSVSFINGDFAIDNVVLDVNGVDQTDNLLFYLGGIFGGGAQTSPSSLFDLFGAQLFTGSLNDPTFKTGDFTLTTEAGFEGFCNQSSYNLDITDQGPPSVAPEPSSVLLLATGVLALLAMAVVKRNASFGGMR
jgi:hypothetical protein